MLEPVVVVVVEFLIMVDVAGGMFPVEAEKLLELEVGSCAEDWIVMAG